MLSLRNTGIAALAFAAVLPGTTLAQEPAEQVADTTTVVEAPRIIAPADIVVRAEENIAALRATRDRIAPVSAVESLAEALPATADEIAALSADTGSVAPEDLTRRELTTLHLMWDRYSRQLEEWQGALADRVQGLGEELDSLSRMGEDWQITADSAATLAYPAAAVTIIDQALALIDSVTAEASARFDTVLSLQNSVAGLRGDAVEALERVQAAQAQAQLGLFTPESPPLWQAVLSPGELSWEQVSASFRQDIQELGVFWADATERLPLQIATLVIVLASVLILRRRSRRWVEDDPELESSARLLDRPFSVLLLVALLTMRAFHPQIPVVVVDLARILALIPALRLLPPLVLPALRKPLYGFAGLWFVNEMLSLLPEGSTPQRVGSLLVAALSMAGLIWSLRQVAPAIMEIGTRRQRFILRVSRAGFITLGGSFVANVLGFVDLGQLLLEATLLSVLLALALYAAVLLIEAIVRLSVRTDTVQSVTSLRRNSNLLIRRSTELTRFLAVALWFAWTLSAFGLLDPVLDFGWAVLVTPLTVGKLSVSLGNIVAFFLAIYVAVLASRLTRFFLEQDVYPRLTLPRGVPGAVTKVSQYLIIGLGLMFAFAASGFDLSSLTLLAGALGVGIGFGLQAIVNNFVSGLILIFERPIQEGDAIQIDTLTGTVKHIGIRASTVRTYDGAEVIVPNADLITGRVTNWTLSDRLRRIEIQVGVAYGSDARQVGEILLDVAKAQPDCLESPEPYVLFDRFGDSALQFIVRFWTSNYSDWLDIESNATFAVLDALNEAGIEIPVPQRDVRIKSDD